jgi:RNA polymerase sigma-70 factor (ECF subfamily)
VRGILEALMKNAEFVKLLMEHRSMLHSFIYMIARDPHLTEDVLQEVSVILWSKIDEFEEGSNFGAWSRSIAYREILVARRHELRAHRYFDDDCVHQILAAYNRRSSEVETTMHRETLRHCLSSMGGHLKEILHCRYAENMSSRDIAARFSRTAQAIDALIYRGKRLLMACVRANLKAREEIA